MIRFIKRYIYWNIVIISAIVVYWYFASTESYNYFKEDNFALLITMSLLTAPFLVFTQQAGENKQNTFITDFSIWNLFIWFVVIIYQFFKRTDNYTFFNQENLGNLFSISLALSFILAVIGRYRDHKKRNPTPENEKIRWRDPKQKSSVKKGSSKTAKAAFLMGGLALLKANKSPKVPHVVPRNDSMRNVNVSRLKGNKYMCTFERWEAGGKRWAAEKKEISPGLGGFSIGDASCNIEWK